MLPSIKELEANTQLATGTFLTQRSFIHKKDLRGHFNEVKRGESRGAENCCMV